MASWKQTKEGPSSSEPIPISQMTDEDLAKRRRKLASSINKEANSLERANASLKDYEAMVRPYLKDAKKDLAFREAEMDKEYETIGTLGPENLRRHLMIGNNYYHLSLKAKRSCDILDTVHGVNSSVSRQADRLLSHTGGPSQEREEITAEIEKRRKRQRKIKNC